MSMGDAILLAAIGVMLYGVVLCALNGLGFWLSPIGNLIGSIGVTVVTSAALPLKSQDKTLVLVATVLALFWFSKDKRDRPTALHGSVAFDQVLQTVPIPEQQSVATVAPEEAEEFEPAVGPDNEDELPVFTLGEA